MKIIHLIKRKLIKLSGDKDKLFGFDIATDFRYCPDEELPF